MKFRHTKRQECVCTGNVMCWLEKTVVLKTRSEASAETNPAHTPWPWMSDLLNSDSHVTPGAVLLWVTDNWAIEARGEWVWGEQASSSQGFRILVAQWIDGSAPVPRGPLYAHRGQYPELEFPRTLISHGMFPWVFYVLVSLCAIRLPGTGGTVGRWGSVSCCKWGVLGRFRGGAAISAVPVRAAIWILIGSFYSSQSLSFHPASAIWSPYASTQG